MLRQGLKNQETLEKLKQAYRANQPIWGQDIKVINRRLKNQNYPRLVWKLDCIIA